MYRRHIKWNEKCQKNYWNGKNEVERIIKELSVKLGITILEEDTLIFFDEIQAGERVLTSLKYFAESNTKYHVIAAGSLLGIAILFWHN